MYERCYCRVKIQRGSQRKRVVLVCRISILGALFSRAVAFTHIIRRDPKKYRVVCALLYVSMKSPTSKNVARLHTFFV